MVMTVDTLTIARELRATEIPLAQAEAIAAAIGHSVSEGAASKSDIELLTQKIEAMEHRITAKIEQVRSSTLIWIVSVFIGGAGLMLALQKLGQLHL